MIPFARRRPFRWLYPSTWLLLVVLTSAATLIVVPGEIVDGEDLMGMNANGNMHMMRAVVEYGWPWPYLEQNADISVPFKDPLGDIVWLWRYSWDFHRGQTTFHPLKLVADMLLAAAFVTVCCWGWNRFRSRQPFWQFRLRGALLSVACLTVLLGWQFQKQRQYKREMEIAAKFDFALFGHFEPRLLSKLIGDDWLGACPWLGHRHIQSLMCMRGDAFAAITPQDLRSFGELSEVVNLQFGNVHGAEPDDFGPICKLNRLSALAMDTPVSPATLTRLCEIPQLRKLFVAGDMLIDDDLKIISRLEDLEELGLVGSQSGPDETTAPTRIGNGGVRFLVALPKLTYLALGDCRVDVDGLRELDQSPRLKRIRLGSRESDAGKVNLFIADHPSWMAVRDGWHSEALAIKRRGTDRD